MRRLTQEEIDQFNVGPWHYNYGIFKEPYGIDISEKRMVIYHRVRTGGYSGGNCCDEEDSRWDAADHELENSLEGFEKVLELVCPEITFLHYRRIMKLVKSNEKTEYEYYGNSDDWLIQWIPLHDLYKELEKLGYKEN
jgi:hypothetical protein